MQPFGWISGAFYRFRKVQWAPGGPLRRASGGRQGAFTPAERQGVDLRLKTDYLLHREVGHVLAALMPQNRLIARVCLHTGLRVGDVVSLRTQDIGLQMMVTEAKTKKRRRVGLTASLLAAIRAQAGPEWAFPGKRPGTHKTRQAVWADVKRAARAFRLPQNVAPHSLRKVYAVELLERYGDIQRVQRALNHSSIETTLIYAMADKLLDAKLKQAKRRKRPA